MRRLAPLAFPILIAATSAAERGGGAHDVVATFKKHCLECHGGGEKVKGDVDLSPIETAADLAARPGLLSTIIEVVDFEEMPPEDKPQPTEAERAALLAELRGMLNRSLAERKSYPPIPIRRMNRFQYNNAVVDLFDLTGSVYSLPERIMREHKGYFKPETGKMADTVTVGNRPLGKSQMIEPRLAGVAAFPQDLRAEHGYDNQADHLSLSPLLMEQFLKLGQSVVDSKDFNPKRVRIWKEFFAEPGGDSNIEATVRARLAPFLARAFRRPPDSALVDRYAAFVAGKLDAGVTFTGAMKSVAAATISSPRFLYLYETASEGGAGGALDAYELATRLSLLLWGSIPDTELLASAESGALLTGEGLRAQFERMLKDRKLKRFCDSFPSQWLQLERIISSLPDPKKFPGFYFSKYRASMHMAMEPLLLFETVLIENRPITELIDSDFTYRSGKLQESYKNLAVTADGAPRGGGGVTVLNFKRLPVTDRRIGGVITNAAVMTMTSGPERTQPITRGAWIAGVIFNNPPEPPPADVPPLGEKPKQGEEHLTLRERLSMHRERADCRGCHEQIDPLGFALENYNAVGHWREKYENGRDVDMTGTLFRKHEFDDVVAFKDAILAEKDRFARGLAGHLLSFALARQLGAADGPALDEIAAATAADDYKIQTLLREVVFSEPFQTKTNPKTAGAKPLSSSTLHHQR